MPNTKTFNKSRARYYSPPPSLHKPEGSQATTPQRSIIIGAKLLAQAYGISLPELTTILQEITGVSPDAQSRILHSKELRTCHNRDGPDPRGRPKSDATKELESGVVLKELELEVEETAVGGGEGKGEGKVARGDDEDGDDEGVDDEDVHDEDVHDEGVDDEDEDDEDEDVDDEGVESVRYVRSDSSPPRKIRKVGENDVTGKSVQDLLREQEEEYYEYRKMRQFWS